MRSFVCLGLLVFSTVLTFGNPPPPNFVGPILPEPEGMIYIFSCLDEDSFFAVIGSDTLYIDSTFTDFSGSSFYPYISIINAHGYFPPEGAIINIYVVYTSTYHLSSIHYDTISLGSSYFHFQYYPSSAQLINAPSGFFWHGGLIRMLEPHYSTSDYGYGLAELPAGLDTIGWCETFDWINTPRINEVKPFGGNRFIELYKWGTSPLSLDGWKLWADGFHTFSSSDSISDIFVLPESLWEPDFDLPPSGALLLLSPGLTKQRSFIWREWTDTSLSANIYADEDSFWAYREGFAAPTPGSENAVGIREKQTVLPKTIHLLSNRPEPFNDRTTIAFSFSERVEWARIDVFDVLGKVVVSKPFEDTRAGYHETTTSGLPSSGVYFVNISTNRGEDVRRITYAK